MAHHDIAAPFDEAWKRLYGRWEASRGLWNDDIRRYLDHAYWASLDEQAPRVRLALERLVDVIAGAERSVH